MILDTESAAPEEAGPSRREAIEAAFDAVEATETQAGAAPAQAAAPEEAPEAEQAPRTAAEKARDEAGRFAKAAKARATAPAAKSVTPTITKKPALGAAPTTPPAPITAGEQPKPEAAQALKAPASWKPAARERWASLPAEVQQEAVRRERETQAALQESSEARKNWSSFQQAVAPFEGMIRAEGGSPIAAVESLLATAAGLRTAPPPQKARMVAEMVRTFGIDIDLLAQALDAPGQPAQQPHQAQPQQQFRDPRFDELMNRIQNGERQRSVREVEDFGAKMEFFADVREDMADQLELAGRRGVKLSLEEAYSRAVKLHPEISEVLSQRERAKAATASQATTQRARAAATSVKSRPAGPIQTPAPNGRRGALEAAWDSLNR